VLAGLSVIAVMVAAEASAQECPQWLKWVCPDSASSTTVSKGARREKPVSGTKASSASERARKPEPAGRHEAAMSQREKEVLFQQFLEWEKGARRNAE
jgi:hypothetical protein